MPTLKWFAHDESIKTLIRDRFKPDSKLKADTYELSGASSSAMSQKAAYAIDNALGKLGFKGSMNMESQQQKESKSTLYFKVEF